MINPVVSVIIPFYCVSDFIVRCAESLMVQTLENVEFIFVDDASTDDSRKMLEKVLSGNPQRCARIITHEINKGLPAARNTGMAYASGEYIYHCDSDDWLEPDMLEKLYIKASEADADYVWSDFFISFDHNERYMKARDYKSPEELLRKGFLAGDMKYNVWNKLVRRRIYDDTDIVFPDGHSMGEDMTMIKLAACAGSVAYVPEALYHYVKTNVTAYTQSYDDKKLDDIFFNTQSVSDFLSSKCQKELSADLAQFKLNVKLPFLLTGNKEDFDRWRSWFPEADKYIFLNSELPFRTKALQWCASHNSWPLVKAYYLFVYKFIYGALYR